VNLPSNVRAVDYVPLNQLLPTCAVLAHHGGMGTFATAAAYGVPQLITDSDVDNALFAVDAGNGAVAAKHIESSITAREVIKKGAGLSLDIRNLNADTMQKQLLRVLNEPSFRKGAADLRADLLAAPTPAEVIPMLERLTAEHKGGGRPT
jgi:glycosyltransferase